MDLNTLNKKRIENGKLIMTEPTVLFNSGTEYFARYTVDDRSAGRIDLIALDCYSDSSYADYILKYNNISNPFLIETGDILLIPDKSVVLAEWKKPALKSAEKNEVKDKFLNTKRLSVQDQKRVEYLLRKAAEYKNGATEILPPNVLKTGKTNISISNGVITVNGPGK
jgi:hypothetical protein